jgi:IS30 family transposase
MNTIIITNPDELQSIVKNALLEYDRDRIKETSVKLFTINQVAKKLGKAHATIKKLARSGLIKSTKDGLITEQAINDYLQNK